MDTAPAVPGVDKYEAPRSALFLLPPVYRPYVNDNEAYLANIPGQSGRNLAAMTIENAGTIAEPDSSIQEEKSFSGGGNAAGADNFRHTVLVVDDEADIRTFICEELPDEYNVISANDGAQALALPDSHNVSLIVSDLMMPVMDGITFCRKDRS